MAASSRDVEATAEAIRRYLQEHTNASDTVDGVLRWWLGRHEFAMPGDHVKEALERLIAEGVVTRWTLLDGTVIYAAAQRPFRGQGRRGNGATSN